MPIPGVTIIVSFFPHEVEADLSLRLIQLDREAEAARIPIGLRERMRRDLLLSHKNVIQGLSPVRTGRLRRSIRAHPTEGVVRSIVGYAPVVERRRRFFEAGVSIASAFDRIIYERYRMEALHQRLKGRDLSEIEGGEAAYKELSKNLSVARSAVSRRTTGRSPSRTQAYGIGSDLDIDRVMGTAKGLTGVNRVNFVADQLVQHGRRLGPSGRAAPAVGNTRIREVEDLSRFRQEMRLQRNPVIEDWALELLRKLQITARSSRRGDQPSDTRETAQSFIRSQRRELDFQRGRSRERDFPERGTPLERAIRRADAPKAAPRTGVPRAPRRRR